MDGSDYSNARPRSLASTLITWIVVLAMIGGAVKLLSDLKLRQRTAGQRPDLSGVWRYGTTDLALQKAIAADDAEAALRRIKEIPPTSIRGNFVNLVATERTARVLDAMLGAGYHGPRPSGNKGPFWTALSRGDVNVVEVFLRHGVDVNALDDTGRPPLFTAVAAPSHPRELTRLLLNRGAYPDAVSVLQSSGGGPRSTSMMPATTKDPGRLLPKAFVFKALKPRILRPLISAIEHGRIDTATLLLDAGANPNASPAAGSPPIVVAATQYYDNTPMLKLLLDHGARVDELGPNYYLADDVRATALYFAAENGNLDAVKLLLAHGADPRKPASNGKTPLEAANGDVYPYLRAKYGRAGG
jgi:ankyrin repeat protein